MNFRTRLAVKLFGYPESCNDFYKTDYHIYKYATKLISKTSPYRDKNPYFLWVTTSRKDKFFYRVTDRFFVESKEVWK